jgi:hypothetical protein
MELQIMQFSQGLRHVIGPAAMVQADKFLFTQPLNCDASADSRMVSPGDEDHPVIEELTVDEWIKLDRQPVDGDVHDTVTKVLLKIKRPRDSVES